MGEAVLLSVTAPLYVLSRPYTLNYISVRAHNLWQGCNSCSVSLCIISGMMTVSHPSCAEPRGPPPGLQKEPSATPNLRLDNGRPAPETERFDGRSLARRPSPVRRNDGQINGQVFKFLTYLSQRGGDMGSESDEPRCGRPKTVNPQSVAHMKYIRGKTNLPFLPHP